MKLLSSSFLYLIQNQLVEKRLHVRSHFKDHSSPQFVTLLRRFPAILQTERELFCSAGASCREMMKDVYHSKRDDSRSPDYGRIKRHRSSMCSAPRSARMARLCQCVH